MAKTKYATEDKRYWAVSDFETTTKNTDYFDENNDGRVILASTVYWDEELLSQYDPNFTEEEMKEWKSKFRIDRSVSIEEWWENIISKEHEQTIFFHNVAFDGYAIASFLHKNGYIPYDDLVRNMGTKFKRRMYKYFLRGNSFLWLKVRVKRNNKEFNIWFRCSKILLQAPIVTLGSGVNIDKHKREDSEDFVLPGETRVRKFYDREPLNSIEEWNSTSAGKRYVEYCDNDVFIALISLWRFSNSFNHLTELVNEWKSMNNFKDFEVLRECFTSAQIAKMFGKLGTRLWLKETYGECMPGDENIYWECSPQQYQFMKHWMRGGLTQINHKYLGVGGERANVGKAIMIDITSDYPAQMVKHSLPYGKVYTASEFDFEGEYGVDYVCFISVTVKSVKLRKECENFPCYPNRTGLGDVITNDKSQPRYLVDCNVEHQAYFTKREWDVLNKYYEIKYDQNSVESYYMKAAPYLRKAAYELFKVKETNKDDEGRKLGAKITVNAMYGATCVRDIFDSSYLVDESILNSLQLPTNDVELREQMFVKPTERPVVEVKYFNDVKDLQFRTFDKDFSVIGKKLVKFKPMDPKEKVTNIACGAYITSMARCYLMETLLEIGVEHFLLCDTDSICLGHLTDEKIEWIVNKYCNKDYFLKDHLGLGSWDLEFNKPKKYPHGPVFTHFQTTGAKQYALWLLKDGEWYKYKVRMAGVSISDKHTIMNPSEHFGYDEYGISLYFEDQTEKKVVRGASKNKLYYSSVILLEDVDKQVQLTK